MPERTRYNFGWTMRLTRRRDFDRVFAAGRRLKAKGLTVIAAGGSGLPHPRLGISIGRSFGSAPARNRMKRRIREAFRLVRPELPPLDYICVPRSDARALSASQLRELLVKAGQNAKPGEGNQ